MPQSKAFYVAIGVTNNAMLSDETAACMVLSESISVMLLTHHKWNTFTTKAIPDLKTYAQVALCISRDSREGVD